MAEDPGCGYRPTGRSGAAHTAGAVSSRSQPVPFSFAHSAGGPFLHRPQLLPKLTDGRAGSGDDRLGRRTSGAGSSGIRSVQECRLGERLGWALAGRGILYHTIHTLPSDSMPSHHTIPAMPSTHTFCAWLVLATTYHTYLPCLALPTTYLPASTPSKRTRFYHAARTILCRLFLPAFASCSSPTPTRNNAA